MKFNILDFLSSLRLIERILHVFKTHETMSKNKYCMRKKTFGETKKKHKYHVSTNLQPGTHQKMTKLPQCYIV